MFECREPKRERSTHIKVVCALCRRDFSFQRSKHYSAIPLEAHQWPPPSPPSPRKQRERPARVGPNRTYSSFDSSQVQQTCLNGFRFGESECVSALSDFWKRSNDPTSTGDGAAGRTSCFGVLTCSSGSCRTVVHGCWSCYSACFFIKESKQAKSDGIPAVIFIVWYYFYRIGEMGPRRSRWLRPVLWVMASKSTDAGSDGGLAQPNARLRRLHWRLRSGPSTPTCETFPGPNCHLKIVVHRNNVDIFQLFFSPGLTFSLKCDEHLTSKIKGLIYFISALLQLHAGTRARQPVGWWDCKYGWDCVLSPAVFGGLCWASGPGGGPTASDSMILLLTLQLFSPLPHCQRSDTRGVGVQWETPPVYCETHTEQESTGGGPGSGATFSVI